MLLLLVLSCVREPGPHPGEEGEVTFWEVLDPGDYAFTACSSNYTEAVGAASEAVPDGSWVIYRVLEDAEDAVSASCSYLDADTCKDVEEVVWTIDGHVLSRGEELEVNADGDCVLLADAVYEVHDEGETGTAVIDIQWRLEGDCEAYEAEVSAESENGYGMAACTTYLESPLAFLKADGEDGFVDTQLATKAP